MKIILTMNEINYDLTPVVDTDNIKKEVEMVISTEGEFYSASFIIPSISQFELGPNIDFSRGLIRNSLVTIEKDEAETQWRIMSDTVTDIPNGEFRHDISLVDRRSETTGINLPGLTLTQSKTDIGDFYRTVHDVNRSSYLTTDLYENNSHKFVYNPSNVNLDFVPDLYPVYNTSNATLGLTLKEQSADTAILESLQLKEIGRTYSINLSLDLVNSQVQYERSTNFGGIVKRYSDATQKYRIRILYNGVQLSSNTITINPATATQIASVNSFWVPLVIQPNVVNYSKSIQITPSVVSSVVVELTKVDTPTYKMYFKSTGSPTIDEEFPSTLNISRFNLAIYSQASFDPNKKYLDEYIDRLLGSVFINETQVYTLSSASRARLSQIVSPEFTIQGYNLFQAIQEVAEFLGAGWEINSNDEIDFIFFDDDNIVDIIGEQLQIRTGTSDLNEYSSSAQLNAENIASSSYKKEGWLSVRAEGDSNAQITTDNVMIKTDDPINYIKSVKVHGIALNLGGSTSTQQWDITNRVIEKSYWDTLPSVFDKSETGRGIMMKNNTWYFERGKPGIYGLSYLGGTEPVFIGSGTGNRALFEIIAATAYEVSDQSTTTLDGGLSTQEALRVTIEYYPFTSSSAHIYKDDQSGFQIERHRYFNEQAKVNDPELLGKVAQNNVNRLGGTEYTKTGYIEDIKLIPKLGTLNTDGRRLTKVILQMTNAYTRYTATYVSDYTKISKFVGKKSDYRAYEIPNTNVVVSNRIKRIPIIFGSNVPGSSLSSYFVEFATGFQSPNPEIAKLSFSHSTGTSTVYNTLSYNNFGKTATWKIKAANNFSFGLKKISQEVEEETVWFQEEVPYTDKFGNINSVGLTLYPSYNTSHTSTTPNNYPASASVGTAIITESFDYYKDAREIFSVEYEFSYGSTNPNKYIIYDGVTKYNSFLNGNSDYYIMCRVLDYIPGKNDKKVDLTRTRNIVTDRSRTSTYFSATVSQGGGKGLVYYDEKTLDLIFVVIDNIPVGTYIIPYGSKPTINKYTVNFQSNGGSVVVSQIITENGYVTEPEDPIRQGYNFLGWYTTSALTTLYDFSSTVTSNFTLYAKWEVISSGNHQWIRVYTTIFDSSIFPEVPSYVCPSDYTSYLPNANVYPVGWTVNIMPYRQCNSSVEVCWQNPINMSDFQVCEERQYRVIDVTP